jgi:ubiquinone/menaquinone biosynthesis C-methylase UbiE
MMSNTRLQRTRRYIRYHWPAFFFLYGLVVAALLLIGVGLAMEWYAFVPFLLAIMLVASTFLISSLWVAYHLNDARGETAAEALFRLSQIRPENHVVCIDLGLKEMAVTVAQRLTSGEVTVIDIYNPQSNIGGSLRRARTRSPKIQHDPRLNWIDGSINLLPLPDQSISAVFMDQVLSEFWLSEEREQLLDEVRRILIPEGRLLVAERVRAKSHYILAGVVTSSSPSEQYWRSLLEKHGFVVQREENPHGLLYITRADKPSPASGKQLSLRLEYV